MHVHNLSMMTTGDAEAIRDELLQLIADDGTVTIRVQIGQMLYVDEDAQAILSCGIDVIGARAENKSIPFSVTQNKKSLVWVA